MLINKKNIIKTCILIITLHSLTGCLPVIFGGAAGSVFMLAKDRSAADALTDVKIAGSIKAAFIRKNFRELYAKIKIEVFMKRVLLTGTVDNDNDIVKAVEIAWGQKDVVEVVNELKIDEKSDSFDLVQYTKDALITSQIKSKTFLSRDIKFGNYTVVTFNNIVYLFGIARSYDELVKVADIAANINGVQKVVSHVKIVSTKRVVRKKNSDGNDIDDSSDGEDPEDMIKY